MQELLHWVHMANTVTVTKQGDGRYIAHSTYEQRALPKAAGFKWDGRDKVWFTLDPAVAAKLGNQDAMVAAIAEQAAKEAAKADTLASSRAADAVIDVLAPEGLAYLPYQRAGIAFASKRAATLLADDMGLGKTIQVIGLVNAIESIRKILIVCPASLKLNWARELAKWLVGSYTIGIANGGELPATDIVIVNYDIADKHKDALRAIEWDLAVLDEAHYVKNADAKRTQAIVGVEKKGVVIEQGVNAKFKLALTGTPIPNRPAEAWTILHWLAPQTFSNFFFYAKDFCAAKKINIGRGRQAWDFSGASNLARLQDKLRSTIMIRRKKADVLTELPAKRRQVVEIATNGATAIVKAEQDAIAAHEAEVAALTAKVELAKAEENEQAYEDAVAALKTKSDLLFTEISKLRRETAVAKVPYVVEHVQNAPRNRGPQGRRVRPPYRGPRRSEGRLPGSRDGPGRREH